MNADTDFGYSVVDVENNAFQINHAILRFRIKEETTYPTHSSLMFVQVLQSPIRYI